MSDDEITRDVDPTWLASIRAGIPAHPDADRDGGIDADRDGDAGLDANRDGPRDDAGLDGDADVAWADDAQDERLDESTVAGDDLMSRIREVVAETRNGTAPSALSTSGATASPSTPSAPPPPPPMGSAPVMPPPPPAILPPTEYWQPPARLRPVGTPTSVPLVNDAPTAKRSSTRVLVAVVVAVLVGLGVGVLLTRGSDDPAPTPTTDTTGTSGAPGAATTTTVAGS